MNKPTLYLVDDESVPLRVMRLGLERAGYAVETFVNGRLALERIREQAPDALITDIEMPVMTGEELCRSLATEYPQRDYPIFVVTGVTDLVHRSWSRQIDNLTFIEKPISMRGLIDELHIRVAASGAAHG